ncbi:MAG: Ig-like domain repeat protein [Myxococcales bacterium]|nr:Ig-like domain repeat protein [Myxococcales bacterium]
MFTRIALALALLAPALAQAAPVRAGRTAQAARVAVRLTAKNAAAVPGETRTLEATLVTSATGRPVAGKPVSFKLKVGNQILALGTGTTNAQGKATVSWKATEINQGAYTLTARFAGDAQTTAAADDANFAMIKGITNLSLGNLIWGPLDAHGGGDFGVVFVELRRQADGQRLAKPITMTVNGQTWQVNHGSNPSTTVSIVLPSNTNRWTVKAQYFGDGANQASSVERTYSH